MVDIKRVEASKNACYNIDNRTWDGFVVASVGLRWRGGPSNGKYVKNYLKEHYPLSKKKLSVTRYSPRSHIYDFKITFQDDAEEAEFIFSIKNLEGSTL